MTPPSHTIRLFPHGRKIEAPHGQVLIDILAAENLVLRSDCGGRGKCGKCRVENIPARGERREILACETRVTTDMEIEIPEFTLFSTHTIGKAGIRFPGIFRDKFKDASGPDRYGIAVDLGTTTLAVYLCNIARGEVLGSVSIKNPQALYGDDVMSRISAIGEAATNLQRLRKLVVEAMEQGVRELLNSQDLADDSVEEMVVVGNPTMIHILLGVNPAPIGCFPYQPVFHSPRTIPAKTLGFTLGEVYLHTLPQVSGFIGGDILAAALAVDFEHQAPGTLLIDLGTNGELMLRSEHGYYATSCATGPAFEGASISCGMQAVPGAITRLTLRDGDAAPEYECIRKKNNQPGAAAGLCGSGVVSAVAELCRHQIILPSGSFNPESPSPALRKTRSGQYCFDIVPETSGDKHPKPVYISQKDIRSVQLGKGALITGIDFLLKKAGIKQPKKIIIAGALGTFLYKDDMYRLGMIPQEPVLGIDMAGNAAGAGAVMVLCHERFRKKAEKMVRDITIVDLAGDPEFHADFVQQLSFPKAE